MSLPRAVVQNKREEVERLLRSGSDVNEQDYVRYILNIQVINLYIFS